MEIPQEWIDKYYAKSGDIDLAPTKYGHVCEQGFANWNITPTAIVVVQCFGDGAFWLDFFKKMTSKTDHKIQFATRRNPKAWARKYGYKVVGYIMEVQ